MFSKQQPEEHNYWISFTDLVSGFLVIFIVATLTLITKNQKEDQPDPLNTKYKELIEDFKAELSGIREVEITDDATIRFRIDETSLSPLFRENVSTPTTYFRGVLDQFVPKYYGIVKQVYSNDLDSFEIKEIRIEGHTDTVGEYLPNLKLSSERALEVQKHILGHPQFSKYDREFQQFVQMNSISCGYSFSRTLDTDGHLTFKSSKGADNDMSRRVEFRILLVYKHQ